MFLFFIICDKISKKFGDNMKKVELLAPAGNMEALVAAIQAGCDAVYIGGPSFGARAFSKNFTKDEIIKAINYAHLYGVKVYITVNTLIYENEVNDFLEYIEFIHKNNVDAVLIQDLGMFDLVRKTFPNLELHASTQMHIHNLDGVKIMERLGMKRVVLARETSIDDIKNIIDNCKCEIEVFVHGALCISYSGQCLMSSLIGGRSGNRGTCAGSCRLKYDVIDSDGKKLNKNNYPLSTKDLNSLEYIGKLIDIGVSSLKIEGRMKSKEYVYKVVKMYRMAIDNYYKNGKVIINDNDLLELKKIFNRNYTKGFLNNTLNNDLINDYRPNHMGVKVGKIIEYKNGYAKIKLTDNVSIGSGLRVITKEHDVGINVNDFYINNKLVKEAKSGDVINIKINSPVNINDDVLITLDNMLNKKIDKEINDNLRKVLINGKFEAKLGNNCKFTIDDGINKVIVNGKTVNKAVNLPTNKDDIYSKLNKLGDAIYKYENLDIEIDNNIFIPLKEINELRRQAFDELNKKRLYNIKFVKEEYKIDVPDFKKERHIACLIDKAKDYSKLDKEYDLVYCEEDNNNTILKLPRVIMNYPKYNKDVMIGEIGGLNVYKNVYTDFSFNVVNSYTVAFLHSLGVKQITLSYELNMEQIKNIIDNYHKRYQKHPNLELIVYGYEEVMISKFSLNTYYKKDGLYLRDMFGNKFKVKEKNGFMYIYNFKCRNNFDLKYYDIGINTLRFNYDYKGVGSNV